LAILSPSTARVLPDPQSKDREYKVAAAHFPLTDNSRKSDYHDDGRKLMLSLFVPIRTNDCQEYTSHVYMGEETARLMNDRVFGNATVGAFDTLSYRSCSKSQKSFEHWNSTLVILEPAVDSSRLLYTQMARQIASSGLTVVIIDHPEDAAIVEFYGDDDDDDDHTPIVYGRSGLRDVGVPLPWNQTIADFADTRVADIDFVLKELSSVDLLNRQFPGLVIHGPQCTDSYIIIGHGFGGMVATSRAIHDRRAIVSINMGGTTPKLACDNFDAYVVLMRLEGGGREGDANWKDSWRHFRGKIIEWNFHDGAILDFSDVPLVVHLSANSAKPSGWLGKNEMERTFHIASCFTSGYARLEGQHDARAVSECVERFPEMVPY
ncbi:hypothetical protein BS50DRAFT_466028, partial [Corynespora cassiicola Philippines]